MAAALNLVSLGSKLRDVALDRIAKATVKTEDLKRPKIPSRTMIFGRDRRQKDDNFSPPDQSSTF